MTELPEGQRCRWCRRPLATRAGPGRPRRYCGASCRQQAYIGRLRAEEAGLSEGELIVARAELDALRDQLYVLEAAVEDVERDLAEAQDVAAYREAIEWLLDAARPLTQQNAQNLRSVK